MLNPLTGRSLFDTFVVPTLLYECETWILSESHLHILESFQAEIGKRILGISKYHSNICSRIGLHWPSVKARVLCRKLTFLAKLLEEDDCLSSHVFRTLPSEDVYEISIATMSLPRATYRDQLSAALSQGSPQRTFNSPRSKKRHSVEGLVFYSARLENPLLTCSSVGNR